MTIGRLHHVVIDAPEPVALAEFYAAVLGLPVTYRSAEFAVVSRDATTSGVAFRLAPDHVPPAWGDPRRPQQVHLDLMVDDQPAAAVAVVALGARPLPGDHVFADPAGHPFCLVRRPGWAPPVAALERPCPRGLARPPL